MRFNRSASWSSLVFGVIPAFAADAPSLTLSRQGTAIVIEVTGLRGHSVVLAQQGLIVTVRLPMAGPDLSLAPGTAEAAGLAAAVIQREGGGLALNLFAKTPLRLAEGGGERTNGFSIRLEPADVPAKRARIFEQPVPVWTALPFVAPERLTVGPVVSAAPVAPPAPPRAAPKKADE